MANETIENSNESRQNAEPSGPLPVTLYTAESAVRQPVALLREICSNIQIGRPLAWRMFVRNLRGIYRQTVLGLFWAFLPPLANTAIWVFLASRKIVDFGDGIDVAYTAYVLAGMVLWQSFLEAINAPLRVVKSNSAMLRRLKFPRESILMVGLYETIFNLVIRSLVLVPILVFFLWAPSMGFEKGAFWTWWTLLAPLGALLLVLLGMGMGMLLLPFGMLYHDVGRALLAITPIWMLFTQIIYPPPIENWASSPFNWLNPASPLLLATRDILVIGQTDHLLAAGIYALIAVFLFVLGFVVYRVSIPILVERI